MAHLRHGYELGVFAGGAFLFSIVFAELVRNVDVGGAVDQDLLRPDALSRGRRFAVAIRNFGWRAAEKARNSIVAQVQLPCATQVKHAGQREHASNRWFMRSKAESELATGGMSGDAEAIEVEMKEFIVITMKQPKCAANVGEASRPPAARIANTAVFDVACSDACLFQSVAEMACIGEVVFRAPVAAVDEKHDCVRAATARHTHLDKLVGIFAVSEAQIGFGGRCGEYVLARHGRAV